MERALRVLLLVAHIAPSGAGKAKNNARFYGPGTGGNLELVTELVPASFESMKNGKQEWVVEFYAPWCPHCQHYKPEYGKVAARVAGMTCSGGTAGQDHPVGVGAVNCVLEKEVCQAEGIKSFPTVKRFDGSGASGEKQTVREPAALVTMLSKSWGPCTEHSEEWVAAHKAAAGEAKATGGSSPVLPGSTEPSDQGEQAISGRRHDIMEAVWFTFKTGIFAGRDTLSKLEMDALADWLNVLVDLLPAGSGSDLIASSLVPLLLKGTLAFGTWDAAVSDAIVQLKARDPHSVYGDGTTHTHLGEGSDWLYCADRDEHIRGYTCGLWTTFHALSVRAAMQTTGGASVEVDAGEVTPGQVALAIHGFISNYFACSDCREHFLAAHDEAEVRALPDKGNAVALWFWTAHNDVNSRLRAENLDPSDGSPPMPPNAPWHMPFPTGRDCGYAQPAEFFEGTCRSLAGGYNLDKVWRFLQSTYGFGAVPMPSDEPAGAKMNEPAGAGATSPMPNGKVVADDTSSAAIAALESSGGGLSGHTIGIKWITAVLLMACAATVGRVCTSKTDIKEGHGY